MDDGHGRGATPRRSSSSSFSENHIHAAMARLEEELRFVLENCSNDIDVESLVDLRSLSARSSVSTGDEIGCSPRDETAGGSDFKAESPPSLASAAAAEEAVGAASTIRRSSYRSTRNIRVVDLLPPDAVEDLRGIAERMFAAGHGWECARAYGAARKEVVELCLTRLGVDRLEIGDVQRLEWEVLEANIRRWIRAARVCVRVVFASERRLCELVFDGLTDDAPFTEAVKSAALQLFGFAEAVSTGCRSPEKLFKMLDLHDAMADLLPDIAALFQCCPSSKPIYTQAAEILPKLTEAIREIISEFETAVLLDPPKTPVPGGNFHPLTRYVMNYLGLISDYAPALVELIATSPSASSQFSDNEPAAAAAAQIDVPEPENQTPLAAHLTWIVAALHNNLENKANLYKDNALSHLFFMNNLHYIVQKVKASPELRTMIGDEYLRRLNGRYRQLATGYQRATWASILHCLRDEGIHVAGKLSLSSGVSRSTVRERFRAFNAAFEEVHRTQAMWFVPDAQLREELRISISERLVPAYRGFLGRYRQHVENGRHPEMYIKYSVEDLELALSDFFEGPPASANNRRRFH
nr:PREDICTED: exocyst complex component EXO70B1-like [Musa acuminata subsp. malaccensis]